MVDSDGDGPGVGAPPGAGSPGGGGGPADPARATGPAGAGRGEGRPPDGATYDIEAQAMIEAFGGIRPMASKLGIPVSTVQGWKQRDTIPAARVGLVESAAAEHGISLPAATPAASASGAPAAAASASSAEAGSAPVTRTPSSTSPSSGSTGTGTSPAGATPAEPSAQESAPGGSPVPGARPRPGMRFSPPEDFAPQPAASDAGPAAAPSTPSTPPSAQTPPPPPPAPAGGASARGAIYLAIVALAVAILWPLAFNAWLGADAEEGGAGGAPAGLDALTERVATLEAAAGQDPADLQAEIAQLRQALDALPAAADDAAVAALSGRVEALEQSATGGVGEGAVPADIAQALDALQRALDGLGGAVSTLEGRVATIETEVDRIASADAGADQAAAVEALRGTVGGLESTLADLRASLDGLAASSEAARADLLAQAQSALEQRAAGLEQRIATLAGSDDAAAAHQAFLIALGQLGSRMRSAQPFADELAALRAVAAADDSLAPAVGAALGDGFAAVEASAEAGLPTLAALQASFDATRRAVLAAADAPAEDVLDEIWSELGSVVTVQRVDGVGAGSVDDILATTERALVAGDLAGAVEAMAGLEAHGAGYAEAAAGWLADARARLAADDAIEAVYDAAMASFRPDPATAGDGDPGTAADGSPSTEAPAPDGASEPPAADGTATDGGDAATSD